MEDSQVLDIILKRRSIRRYKPDPVPNQSIKKLVEACRWAPSGGNRQPWRLILIRDPKIIKLVKAFAPGLIGTLPPLMIAVCAHATDESNKITIMDVAMATENMLLTATALGLGACLIGSFNEAAVREILEIPSEVRLMLLMTVGYPAETPNPPQKKLCDEIAFENQYGTKIKLNRGNASV